VSFLGTDLKSRQWAKCSAVVSTWFSNKRGTAIGMVAAGASVAGLIYPLMFRMLTSKIGFHKAQRYVATLTVLTCILAFFIARPKASHPWRTGVQWQTLGTYWDTGAFRNRSFLWLTIAICCLFFGFYPIFFSLEEWAFQNKLGYRAGPESSALKGALQTWLLLSIMNISSTFGRLVSSFLSDHMGALKVHAFVTFVGAALAGIFWPFVTTVNAAICFVVFFGIFSGSVIGLPPASVAYILGHEHQDKLGQWVGMMYSCAALFALTGPLIAGHMVTEFNTFIAVQAWSGSCLFLSACCMIVSLWSLETSRNHMDRKLRSLQPECSTPTAEKTKTGSEMAAGGL